MCRRRIRGVCGRHYRPSVHIPYRQCETARGFTVVMVFCSNRSVPSEVLVLINSTTLDIYTPTVCIFPGGTQRALPRRLYVKPKTVNPMQVS